MPTTPVNWLGEHRFNLNTAGSQSDPVITQLASGYILIVWTDANDSPGTPGAPAGRDIVGRIVDPLGGFVTSEFRLNTFSSSDNEELPSIAALADGGFMVTYKRTGQFDDIFYEVYAFNSVTGAVTHGNDGFIHFDNGVNVREAVVASASASSTMTAFVLPDSTGTEAPDLYIRAYNPATDSMANTIRKTNFAEGPLEESVSDPDICALANGSYAITYSRGFLLTGIDLMVVDANGNTLLSTAITSAGSSSSVAPLKNGGFVASWTTGLDIYFKIYNGSGHALTPAIAGGSQAFNNQQWGSDVAGLSDGSLVVGWVDGSLNQLRGQRYGATGVAIGSEFVIAQLTDADAAVATMDIEAFQDGRFAVTWGESTNIQARYFDVRDQVGSNGFYTPRQWKIGTVNDDRMSTPIGTEYVRGWTGDDVITGSNWAEELQGDAGDDYLSALGGNDRLIGGTGNDLLQGGAGADVLNGGGPFIFATESDMASYQGSNAAVTVNLATGTGAGGHAQGDTLSSIEHLLGSSYDDTLIGNASANNLDGGTGADTMAGGAGNDRFTVDNAGDVATEAPGQGTDIVYSSVTYKLVAGAEIEMLGTSSQGGTDALDMIGNEFAQRINGNNGGNRLYGGAGNDTLVGYGGNDNLEGQAGNDRLYGISGADKFIFRYSTIATAGADHIVDFGSDDLIYVDHPTWAGPLAASSFRAGANALDADDRFIWYAPNHSLYFDPDGNGAIAKTLIAIFDNGYNLTAADIVLF